MPKQNTLVAAIFGTFLSLWALSSDADDTAGKDKYMAYGCYQCHGTAGQGAITGPRLAPSPLPFQAFRQLLRTPSNRMPAYAPDVLSDSDLKIIHEYLASIQAPPALDEIPILSRQRDLLDK